MLYLTEKLSNFYKIMYVCVLLKLKAGKYVHKIFLLPMTLSDRLWTNCKLIENGVDL